MNMGIKLFMAFFSFYFSRRFSNVTNSDDSNSGSHRFMLHIDRDKHCGPDYSTVFFSMMFNVKRQIIEADDDSEAETENSDP